MTSQFEVVVACIHDDPILEGIACSVGRLKWKEAARAPRVSWVPTSFIIEATQGAQRQRDSNGRSNRVIAIRRQTFAVHIHGDTLEQLEFLMDAVVTAVSNQTKGSHFFGAGSIDSQTEAVADFALDGEKATLDVILQLPIFKIKQPGRVMTSPTKEGSTIDFESELDGSTTEVCAWTEP